MKAMNVSEEMIASLHEGSVGEVVRDLEDKAKVEGKVEGKAEGKVEGKAENILRIVEKRGVELTAEQRASILGCTDLETLNRWFDASLDATTADEIFA